MIGEQLFEERFDDKELVIALYEQNIRDVQAAFSSERLLTYELGSGWEPICSFLDKPVPETPFPKK